ncbi:MAG: hypothetical protein WAL50_18920 [Kineosporiaceae bacterium]
MADDGMKRGDMVRVAKDGKKAKFGDEGVVVDSEPETWLFKGTVTVRTKKGDVVEMLDTDVVKKG